MKKIIFSVLAIIVAVTASAQSTSRYSSQVQSRRDVVTSGNNTYYYDAGFKYQLGYTVPFLHEDIYDDVIDGRYGVRAEVGYMTAGQYSFYGGLAYQFYSFKVKDFDIRSSMHELNIPAQLSVRFPSVIPTYFRVGPYLDLLMGAYTEGEKVSKDMKFGDRVEWGLQFNFAISCFQVGYSLQYDNGNQLYEKGFNSSKLTIGVIF